MSRPFEIQLPTERAYLRRGLFALELLDPVTLARVNEGVRVVADGLRGEPSVNSSGLFVWRDEDVTRLKKIAIDPRTLPYDPLELTPDQLELSPASDRVTTVELPVRGDYPFTPGVTAARGTLLAQRLPPLPVAGAAIRFGWLDDDGVTWHEAPTVSRTSARGDYAAVLRLAPSDAPQLDAQGALTVRLQVRREANQRRSGEFLLPQGRVADPTTLTTLILAWDELLP